MNPPRVDIDNESCRNATVIKVDSANKNGILLDVMQVLTDLNLIVTKAYISSDGGWFMDEFHVTDKDGKKITDEWMLDCINNSLGPDSCFASSSRRGSVPILNLTSIELIGHDRPGLLSEMSAVLTNLKCNVVNAQVWTHNNRVAAVIHVTDEETRAAITDHERLAMIKKGIRRVLRGSNKSREKTLVSHGGFTHIDRRLHQMMFADRDFECSHQVLDEKNRPDVNVVNWEDKDYSLITILCKDRPKLVFDTICTLTDMQYVIFHGSVKAEGPEAYQEYCVRHVDGSSIKSNAERERIIQGLKAAIARRVSEGLLKLEVCTTDRIGLLSDVTRIFRENSLSVIRAEVTTEDGVAVDTFYVSNASPGYPVDAQSIASIRETLGRWMMLKVTAPPGCLTRVKRESPSTMSFIGGLFKSGSLSNRLIRSYS